MNADSLDKDRSVPRRLRNAGDLSRDRRGRHAGAPPILHYGFRPFFLLASIYAGLAIPVWLCAYLAGLVLPGPFAGMQWHAHEMLFGYLGAVIAGFVLTAVPNWTGRLPLSGRPLAFLVALWLAGRIACAFVANPMAALVIDLAFPAILAAAVWREVLAGRNWRNAPIATMLTLFALANAAHHAEGFNLVPEGLAVRTALGVAVVLVALIGGRIVPSFTRNWLVKQGSRALPASFGLPDKAALASVAVAVLAWIAAPLQPAAGIMLVAAGVLLAIRLARWRGFATVREPILVILHLGYGWLAVSLALLGAASLSSVVPYAAAVHALTAGAIGTMTLAVMTRASLGHTGHSIEADGWTVAIYGAVTLGAVLRVAAPFTATLYMPVLVLGGILWCGAFLLFAVRYGPMLCRARTAE